MEDEECWAVIGLGRAVCSLSRLSSALRFSLPPRYFPPTPQTSIPRHPLISVARTLKLGQATGLDGINILIYTLLPSTPDWWNMLVTKLTIF